MLQPFFLFNLRENTMQYFTLNELTKSERAEALQIDNTPNKQQISNLEKLVDNVLDPLRSAYGKPINVTSGFRCEELNAKIKGSRTSQHCKGEAADLIPKDNADLKLLFRLILTENLPFDQLIFEKSTWIHVSHRNDGKQQRGEILTYDGKAYQRITRQQALQLFK